MIMAGRQTRAVVAEVSAAAAAAATREGEGLLQGSARAAGPLYCSRRAPTKRKVLPRGCGGRRRRRQSLSERVCISWRFQAPLSPSPPLPPPPPPGSQSEVRAPMGENRSRVTNSCHRAVGAAAAAAPDSDGGALGTRLPTDGVAPPAALT